METERLTEWIEDGDGDTEEYGYRFCRSDCGELEE